MAIDAMGRIGDWLTETPLLEGLTATADSPIAALADTAVLDQKPPELTAVNGSTQPSVSVERDAIGGAWGFRQSAQRATALGAQIRDGVLSGGLETHGPNGGDWFTVSSASSRSATATSATNARSGPARRSTSTSTARSRASRRG